MAQNIPGTINPATTSGSLLATILSSFFASLLTQFSGASRPTNAQEGFLWLNTAFNPPVLVMCGAATDGSQDRRLFALDTPSGGMIMRFDDDLILRPVSVSTITAALSSMVGATSEEAGTAGIVAAPAAGQQNFLWSGAGTWVERAYLRGFKDVRVKTDDYTLTLDDVGCLMVMNSASNKQFLIPGDVAFELGTAFAFLRRGTGEVTIAGTAGATIEQEENKFKLEFQKSMAAGTLHAASTWVLNGRLKT